MTRLAAIPMIITAVVVAGAGCGGSKKEPGNHCELLTARLCAGQDLGYCDRVEAWLASAMRGPDGAPLEPADADHGCTLILEDSTLLDAYTRKVAEELAAAPAPSE